MNRTEDIIGPIHPGEFLSDLLGDMGITAYALAKAIGKPQIQVSRILNGRSGISAHMARLIGGSFGLTPQMLLNWQSHYDLETDAVRAPRIEVKSIVADGVKVA